MDQNTIIIICVVAVIGLALFLVLRKSGGSFSATGEHGKTKFGVSAKSNQPQAPAGGQIAMKRVKSERKAIEALTDKGGKIDLEDATAELGIKASTTGSAPSPPKA